LLPRLEVLRIDGKGVGKWLVDGIAKSARPNLKDITLETSSSLGGASIIKGLSTAPNLERISLGYLSEELLASLAAMLSAARGGGTPLLRSLYQTGDYPEKLTLLAFARIGQWLPELTDLTVSFGLKERDYNCPGFGVHEVRWPLSIAPFATLRRLNLYRMSSLFGGHLTSAELKRLLQLVLTQCPRLEALALTHGVRYRAERGEAPSQLPELGDSLHAAPCLSSLVMLHLQDIAICPLELPLLESLRLLRLVNCGDASRTTPKMLVASLSDRCPKLDAQGCILLHEAHMETSESVTTYKVRTAFPASDISELSLAQIFAVLAS
jgi:hypothetical protein